MARTFVFIFFLLAYNNLWALGSTAECSNKIQAQWDVQRHDLKRIYEEIDPTIDILDDNFPSALVQIRNSSTEAVYTLHGFMGSPAEMRMIGELAFRAGYDVFSDTIPGFGGTALIANQFNRQQWLDHTRRRLLQLASCYDKVHLVGFSTGGLLIHRFLYDHPELAKKFSVTLYSPFYDPNSFFLKILGSLTGDIPVGVSVKTMYKLSKHPDLVVLLKEPEAYLQDIPLAAANQVFELGHELQDLQVKNLRSIASPLMLFLAHGDRVLNFSNSEYMTRVFNKRQLVALPSSIPHHLMVSSVSASAQAVAKDTLHFIESN
ncbi:alpha/beta fold hydrolase [Bdellovibrio sp.]|uniref:alpha/beta hydrolase n=1 Tax=Bdellovibrio sp. TaxID=28201 RepID=UPI0032219C63